MAVENLITENLDIWTSAIKTKSAAGRGSSKKLELVGVKKLRELILELAARGKLVPQDPNDEPASGLLKKIETEKARLLKDGKIRKQKPLQAISDDEKPFELPEGWLWVRLSNLGLGFTGKTPSTKEQKYFEGNIPFIGPGQITPSGVLLEPDKYLSEEGLSFSTEARTGDILMVCIGGSIGKSVICDKRIGFNQQINILRPLYVDPKYLNSTVSSERFYRSVLATSTGSATPIINRSKWEELLVPVCSLTEQHRIVAKVDELMALCDQLEAQTESSIDALETLVEVLLATLTNAKDADELNDNWQRLSQHFDVLFTTQTSIDQLKQTILQLAVMGKLVKQDPSDEPACKLLERIATEKQQLIKDGKIKKKKPLPPITDKEKPFELPQGWEWAYLNSLLPQFQNGASSRGDKGGKDVVVLRLADIKNWKISLNDTRSLEIAEETIKRYSLKKGDVLIIRVNGSADIVGRFITCESDLDSIYCDHFIRMNFPIECLFTPYLFLLGSSDLIRSRIANLFVSTAGQKTVNQTHIGTLPISLPPFAEQERIVKKVDELMALCDSLKILINEAQSTQLHLTDAIVELAL